MTGDFEGVTANLQGGTGDERVLVANFRPNMKFQAQSFAEPRRLKQNKITLSMEIIPLSTVKSMIGRMVANTS